MSDSETILASYGSDGPMQSGTALAVSDPLQYSSQLLDERWGHSGKYWHDAPLHRDGLPVQSILRPGPCSLAEDLHPRHISLHAGFQPAGTFARKPKRQTGGDLHGKMGTLELQMQALLARMHRHNAGIAARHAAIERVEGISLKQVRAQFAEAVNVSEQEREQISKGGTRHFTCSNMS